jgi:hypothetical protein
MKTFKQFFTDDVDIYKKGAQDLKPALVATVDPEYYKDTLTKYIKLGSIDSAEVRNIVIQRLTTANGLISNNLELFQGLVMDLDLDITDPTNFEECERKFVNTIKTNSSVTVDEIIFAGFNKKVTDSPYYSQCWAAFPEAPVMGSPGEGELFLSFFCNGTKPKKGDILIRDFSIELKGPGGRLFKNRTQTGLYDPETFELLNLPDPNNPRSGIDNFAQYIANISGYNVAVENVDGVDELKNLLNQNEFLINQLAREASEVTSGKRTKLRNSNTFVLLAGYAQIFAYKLSQKFDALAVFDPKPGFYIYGFIVPDNLADMYKIINTGSSDQVSGIQFRRRGDGNGYSIYLQTSK